MRNLIALLLKDRKFIIRTAIRFSAFLLIAVTLVISNNLQYEVRKETVNTEKIHQSDIDIASNKQQNIVDSNSLEEVTKGQSQDTTEATETYEKDLYSLDDLIPFDLFAIYKNQAYEYYSYSDTAAQRYAECINYTADKLSGKSDVYALVVPTSMGIQFPEELKEYSCSTDQSKAMESIYSYLDGNVIPVQTIETLKKHKNEYIFFRTDHHWTQLGSYYAYCAFCTEKGISANDIKSFDTEDFDGFYGTFYFQSGCNEALSKPDTVTVYYPLSDSISFEFTDIDGKTYAWKVISDVSDYPADSKYYTFSGSDHPISLITNKDLADGESCVVIKDSFGNALVPFLSDHYKFVYIIDYRYWKGSFIDFVNEKNIGDVIFCNSISLIRSTYTSGLIEQIVR